MKVLRDAPSQRSNRPEDESTILTTAQPVDKITEVRKNFEDKLESLKKEFDFNIK